LGRFFCITKSNGFQQKGFPFPSRLEELAVGRFELAEENSAEEKNINKKKLNNLKKT
jgi:hypothetical protein